MGIHVALLPNGKVLAFDSVGDAATETFPVHNFTRATIYDPITGTHTPATVDTGHNIFCAGFAHLFDGSLFIAGGNRNAQLQGIVQTHLFNPVTNGGALDRHGGRSLVSVVMPLTNGEMLITEGGPDTPEVRRTDGTLRTLSTASLNLPRNSCSNVAPDGRVFESGRNQTIRKLYIVVALGRSLASAMLSTVATAAARSMISARRSSPAGWFQRTPRVRSTPPRHATSVLSRRHLANRLRPSPAHLTLFADGSVLVTGGNSTGASTDRYERRRAQRGAVRSGDGPGDHPRGAGCDTPVSLDRVLFLDGRVRSRAAASAPATRSGTSRRTPRSSHLRTG